MDWKRSKRPTGQALYTRPRSAQPDEEEPWYGLVEFLEQIRRGHIGGPMKFDSTVDLERRAAANKSLGVVVFHSVERAEERQNSIAREGRVFERRSRNRHHARS